MQRVRKAVPDRRHLGPVPKKVYYIEAAMCIDCGALRGDLPRRRDHEQSRRDNPRALSAPNVRSPSSIPTTATDAACASTFARSIASRRRRKNTAVYLGKVQVNEKTCVGCLLCEEVCGWDGIYIMPSGQKEGVSHLDRLRRPARTTPPNFLLVSIRRARWLLLSFCLPTLQNTIAADLSPGPESDAGAACTEIKTALHALADFRNTLNRWRSILQPAAVIRPRS